ncbi:hypothetical protein C8T65DRAFT_660438 [Cerioporus squamosus]|nr:hypothetical protein C8T65DRAFT_660438 [Cerioporus squamosus]
MSKRTSWPYTRAACREDDPPLTALHLLNATNDMPLALNVVSKVKLPHPQERQACPVPGCSAQVSVRDLKRHMDRHSPPSLKCPHCPWATRQKVNLQGHISARHTRDRPHKCPYTVINPDGLRVQCDAAYNHASGLTRHRQRKHAAEPPRSRKTHRKAPSTVRSSPVPVTSSHVDDPGLSAPSLQETRDDIRDAIKHEEVVDECLGTLLHALAPPPRSFGDHRQSAMGIVPTPRTRTNRIHPYQYHPAHLPSMQHSGMLS